MVQTLVSLRSVIVKWWWATRNRIADDTVHTQHSNCGCSERGESPTMQAGTESEVFAAAH